MKLIKLTQEEFKSKVQEFYDKSMFTFEGLCFDDEVGMKHLEEDMRKAGYVEEEFTAYCFTGDFMNEHFGLTESNAYKEDLNFVVIPNFYNPTFKMFIGARWFDDIVSNNTIRQSAINHQTEEDYGTEKVEEEEEN